MALPVAAITAALSTIAGLGGKAFKDADEARKKKALKEQHRQEAISAILKARTQGYGGDTQRSDLESEDQRFQRYLESMSRDTSGDFIPVAQGIAGTIGGIAAMPKRDELDEVDDALEEYDRRRGR